MSKTEHKSRKANTYDILRIAELCYLAQKKYPTEQVDELKRQLRVDATTFSKLVQIGKLKTLPGSVNQLHRQFTQCRKSRN
jgi:hypothetical protein